MSNIFLILRQALHDTWEDLWTVLVCNLLWLLAQILILPGPPATVALFYYANRLANGEVADLSDFWRALRRFWGPAWRWGLLNLLMVAFLIGDESLSGQLIQGGLARLIQGFYLALLATWLLLQFFALPFLIEQESPSVGLALRNGAVMLGRNIGFSVSLGLLLGFLLLAGTPLFMLSFAFGGMFIASAGNHAVLNRLAAYRFARENDPHRDPG